MSKKKVPFLAAMACAMLAGAAAVPVIAETGVPTIPIEVWSLRSVVASAELSPDGKHLAVLKTKTKDGENVLEIYKTDDLSKPWRTLNADPMEMTSAQFVSDTYIYGSAWQVIRNKVNGPEDDVRGYRSWAYNLETNKFQATDGNFQIVGLLPKEPDHVLISDSNANDGGLGVDPFEAFRPRSYYRFNLKTGNRELVLNGDNEHPNIIFDQDGNPRWSTGIKTGSNKLVNYYRLPGEKSWREIPLRYDMDEMKNLYRVFGGSSGLVGFSSADPTIGYVIDSNGEDKNALYEFDFKTGALGRKLFAAPNADVLGIKTNSMYWAGDNTLSAAIYPGAKYERHWFDPEEKKLYDALEKAIPNAWQVNVDGRSRDGKTMVVTNVGPRDPGSYYLFLDGRLAKIGSANPLIKPEQLSDVEFITYKARDGRNIPAYVTKPKGTGPFPLVVIPHGGPHVNEVISYDEWGQMLANAGYMVLQPQYRISTGWGQDHFDAGYGEHGLKMQDDKDDGALHLVKQGLVDPNRIAMFGWSYGGYAALVASSRTPQIYQCAIAGASSADVSRTYRARRNPYSPKAMDDWAQRRGMIGIDPMKEAAKTNIPLLLVHGDVDRRVEYWNFTSYKQELEKASIPNVQYLTLKGADHFSNTHMYDHQEQFYTKLLDFLKKDCGPGGL